MKDEDKTYENEIKHEVEDRGSNDLTLQIDMLTKQKKYMQSKCREAGAAILDLESQVNELKRDNSLLAMDVATLTNRLRDAGF
jgi:hypothetical protein